MLPLILVLLSQAPAHAPIGVVVSSKRPGSEAAAQKVSARLIEALTGAGLTGLSDDSATVKLLKKSKLNPRDCQGAGPCLIKLAGSLGPTAVLFGVDVGKIGDSLAIHIEAVGPDATIAAVDVPADAELKPGQLDALDGFAKSVVAKLAPAPATPAVVADAPKQPILEPTPVAEPPPVLVARAPAGPSGIRRAAPWIVGGGAVAALAVSGIFFGLGAQDKSTFDASVNGGVSRLPGSELQTIGSRGNSRFTIGLSTAAVGVALAAFSTVLFATE